MWLKLPMPEDGTRVKIKVNDQETNVDGTPTLDQLLKTLGMCGKVAVVLNDEVVPQDRRAACPVKDGDRIEVLTFAGGG